MISVGVFNQDRGVTSNGKFHSMNGLKTSASTELNTLEQDVQKVVPEVRNSIPNTTLQEDSTNTTITLPVKSGINTNSLILIIGVALVVYLIVK